MQEKKTNETPRRAMRWSTEEWEWLDGVTKSIGTSRSEFVRRATMEAAKAIAGVRGSYFVEGAIAPPQNTRINLFSGEAGQKSNTGGVRDAADCSRSDGEAKGGATKTLQGDRPRRAIASKG